MPQITMKELLESGVHFGHQTKRWNPRMKEYIFGERNGIHIIDLQKTLKMFKEAARFISDCAGEGKSILFVGTKRQAQEAVAEEAKRCSMYYVNSRWLGGLLTNWETVQKSIERLKTLEHLAHEEGYEGRAKKEVARLERERKHLDQNLAGIKDIPGLPDVLFVIDSNKEEIAVQEARKLQIPVVAVVDTNCDPQAVDYVIPGNDDALRAIRLFAAKMSDAILEGNNLASEEDFQAEDGAEEATSGEGIEAAGGAEPVDSPAEGVASPDPQPVAAAAEAPAPEPLAAVPVAPKPVAPEPVAAEQPVTAGE